MKKTNNKNNVNYEFIDMELLKSLIANQDAIALIRYAQSLEDKNIPQSAKRDEEIKICQNIVADYILSLTDEVDLFPDIYEKVCAKLIENKTPEESMAIYNKIKNQYFCIPSHTILKYISSNTKKADTCLFFIKDLEESYQRYGNKSYDEYILDFYKRFRAVCSKEEFEKFVESGMQDDNDLQKQ